MRLALTDPDGQVVNVAVWPDGQAAPATWAGLDAHSADGTRVGPGWWRNTDGGYVAPPKLTSSVDGLTATVTYADQRDQAPAEVTFTVTDDDGENTETVALDGGEAALDLTADAPGEVEVSVDALDETVVVTFEQEQ